MDYPQHEMLVGARESNRRRAIGLAIVGLLHVVLIWALVSGLAMRIITTAPQLMQAEVLAPQKQDQVTVPKPALVVPKDSVAPPEIQIQTPEPTMTVQTAGAPAAATSVKANGVTSTHTTPPYPSDARDRGQEGKVSLHILVSAGGDVTDAIVTKSSGVLSLDQAAVNWVKTHWKYKPAMVGNIAVASAADAVVVFNLKNAG